MGIDPSIIGQAAGAAGVVVAAGTMTLYKLGVISRPNGKGHNGSGTCPDSECQRNMTTFASEVQHLKKATEALWTQSGNILTKVDKLAEDVAFLRGRYNGSNTRQG